MQNLRNEGVRVEGAEGKASFQRVLPMSPLLAEVAGAIEQTATQAGLLMMKAQSRFRRIQAYSQLPQLINAMATLLDKKEATAQSCRRLSGRKPNSHGKRDNLLDVPSFEGAEIARYRQNVLAEAMLSAFVPSTSEKCIQHVYEELTRSGVNVTYAAEDTAGDPRTFMTCVTLWGRTHIETAIILFGGLAVRQVVQDDRNHNPRALDAHFAVAYLRVHRDVIGPVHMRSPPESPRS